MSCDHPGLVVHRHDADQQRRLGQRVAQRIGVEQAVGSHRQEDRLETFGGQVGHRLQDTLMFGGNGDDAPARFAHAGSEAGGALDRDVIALGRAGGEHDLLASAPISAATCARAASTAASASLPIACSTLCGLP